ncbi:HNH endonuclease [Rhizobium sp. Leaf384]|uniref:HNH endonuclease signature motif containing protein n=1 Tax=Rhizobium sp. Leaf384 TaxID=1736358 RepID=UPI0007143B5B|nr:HNH endonuclease signature motif containing protein [Rhizobium sp. Leaf384]KQS74043.1 HNH endonuclease [Rhizobium sp. Leaf384]
MRLRSIKPTIRQIDARVVKPKPKTADAFYLSPEWRSLMHRLIAERGRRCEEVGCGRVNTRIFGDHIVELKDGGPLLDPSNIKLLCGSCHTTKTLAQRARRMAERF